MHLLKKPLGSESEIMTLRALEFSNLKCFSALRLELSPLTLFTGFNSAGKSTTLQSLLLLGQGLSLNPDSAYLSPNGPIVRLGQPGDLLSSQAKERRIEISVFTMTEHASWSFAPVSWGFNLVESSAHYPHMRLSETRKDLFRIEKVAYQRQEADSQEWVAKMWGNPDTGESPSDLLSALQNIVFLHSERGKVSDVYPSPDNADITYADVGREGQYAPWWYEWAADEEIDESRRHPDEHALSLRRQMDAYLNDLFPDTRATVNKVENTSLMRLGFGVGAENDWRSPANVGYGLVYVFPILVAALLAKKGQVLIIESPEAHLHPRAQSRMGEILARIAAAGVQILIESHSDHILNGIRRAVKDNVIPHPDIAVHFFSGADSDGGHGVISPTIDTEGSFDDWPKGFFDQSESDLATLTGWDQSS